jgi:glutathione peroxidase-family protein
VGAAKIRADPRFGKVVDRASASEGQPAPDVSGPSFDGREVKLSSLRGQVVLLYVWFTNCPPCTRQTPELGGLAEAYRKQGLAVLGINADRQLALPYDDEARAAYLKRYAASFPNIHLTPALQSALGEVSVFPTLFLIGRDGTVVRHYINYQPRELLQRDIEKALASGA